VTCDVEAEGSESTQVTLSHPVPHFLYQVNDQQNSSQTSKCNDDKRTFIKYSELDSKVEDERDRVEESEEEVQSVTQKRCQLVEFVVFNADDLLDSFLHFFVFLSHLLH